MAMHAARWTALLCVAAASTGAAPAAEKPKQPPAVAADIVMEKGEEVKLTDIPRDGTFRLLWGAFDLKLKYRDMQKCEFLSKVRKVKKAMRRRAKVWMRDGTELDGETEFFSDKAGVSGDCDFGKRSVSWTSVSSISFRTTPEAAVTPLGSLGTMADREGNAVQMLSTPEVRFGFSFSVDFVKRELFGSKEGANYLALPHGRGCVFVPVAQAVQVTAGEKTWDVKTKDGKTFSLVVVGSDSGPTLHGRCQLGSFSILASQVGQLTLEGAKAAGAKPKEGVAAKPIARLPAVAHDRLGASHRFQGLRLYYRVYHYTPFGHIRIGRAPSDYTKSSDALAVVLPDGGRLDIELAKLRSISFDTKHLVGTMHTFASRTGKTTKAKWYCTSARGVSYDDRGFIGRVIIGQSAYWAYVPVDGLKGIEFE